MPGFSIPIELREPRCFVLESVINPDQAYAQAGAFKGRVFGFDLGRVVRRSKVIEAKLLHRRLVPFWHIQCQSHFDFSRLNNYQLLAHHPDAVKITLQGPNEQAIDFRVDQTGRSGGQVTITGIERCVTNRDKVNWIDSYVQREDMTPQMAQQEQKRMQAYIVQRPKEVVDLEEFVASLSVGNSTLYQDGLETLVVPPLETADNVVRRSLKEVMVAIDAPMIHEAWLKVENIDLYFRPLFVFQFDKVDDHGNTIERKLEELDALNKDHWTTLATTEFQLPRVPWTKILRLSSDIGTILLQDIPIAGTAFKVTSTVLDQGPDIVNSMRGN
jgi:hypothetical protein